MSKENNYQVHQQTNDDGFDIKEQVFKYLSFWHYFLIGGIFAMMLGVVYIMISNTIYDTTAKVKIIDESKEMELPLGDLGALVGANKVNLENEIEIVKSYRILEQVVKELHLDIDYKIEDGLKKRSIWKPIFTVKKVKDDEYYSKTLKYEIIFEGEDLLIIDVELDKDYRFELGQSTIGLGLPFELNYSESFINEVRSGKYKDVSFFVSLSSLESATLSLKESLFVSATNKDSEILILELKGDNSTKTEDILNTLIDKFNKDGILDRQLVSKRTIDFVNERIVFLAEELDSIEVFKKDYKQKSNISFLEADTKATLQRREQAKQEVLQINTQMALADMLGDALRDQKDFSLLPANIGIESQAINDLVGEYNKMILNRQTLLVSAGDENPRVKNLSAQLEDIKNNIISTLNIYRRQLKSSYKQLSQISGEVNGQFYQLPENEKKVRSIERQQTIKEALYVLLLQKREEAAISYAVTSPSIKVVDYAITKPIPVAPRKKVVLLASLIFGLALPFGILYLRFLLDNKIHGKVDLEKEVPQVPVLAELPFVEGQEILNAGDSRSSLAEAFRILSTNVEYLLPKEEEGSGRVVFVTSTKKGEGKTFVALNLSLALASLNKKVLLVGSDLRNPQLHKYFEKDKNFSKGLSGYLFDTDMQFKECWEEGFTDFPTHKICFSGVIPPNAPQLLASKRYGQFLEEARKEFDYVIVDTAPTILVTDTLMISKYADETVYVTRADYTEKEILNFAKELHDHEKLNNMAFVVNAVGKSAKGYGYKYGYGYSYGYGYGYGYNYGYGYGYGSDEDTSAKKKKKGLFKRFRK